MSELCFQAAHELRRMLLNREISASELLEAFIAQTGKTNPTLNALVTLDFYGARARAKEADAQLAAGEAIGGLHGLPIAVKDVFATRGLRTTLGNPLFTDNIPTHDDILVERERAAGAVILGKSNTPDCASGGRTYNEIFGLTRNPWDLGKTTCGSGGGGVSALAGGMVAIADGSDIGGSVRSPAAWTNCVGFRPTAGRLPGSPTSLADGEVSTAGVFGRCVKDVALFMEAVEGPDIRSAQPYPAGPAVTLEAVDDLPKDINVAWFPDFAERMMDPEITDLFDAHRGAFEAAGMTLSGAQLIMGESYRQLYSDYNAYAYVKGLPTPVLEACLAGEQVKPSIATNVLHYLNMGAMDIFTMFRNREELKISLQDYMQDHAAIITPPYDCLPFGAEDAEAEARCDWSALYLAPLLGLPSVVMPCGFTQDGMPNGIMITGRAGEDLLVLQIARAFERETNYWKRRADPAGWMTG